MIPTFLLGYEYEKYEIINKRIAQLNKSLGREWNQNDNIDFKYVNLKN